MEETRGKPSRGKTTAVGDVLPRLLEEMSRKTGGLLPLVVAKWTEIVGEQVAFHTIPSALRGKNLTVEVDDSVWMAELARFHKKRIRDAVNHNLNSSAVEEVIFRPKRKS